MDAKLGKITYLLPEWDQTKARPQYFTFKESERTCVCARTSGYSTVLAREPIPMQGIYSFSLKGEGDQQNSFVGIAAKNVPLDQHIGRHVQGWGYHCGGSIYNSGDSAEYGHIWFQSPNLITCIIDRNKNTLAFLVNGCSQCERVFPEFQGEELFPAASAGHKDAVFTFVESDEAQQDRLAREEAERQAKAEAERLEAERQAKAEAERLKHIDELENENRLLKSKVEGLMQIDAACGELVNFMLKFCGTAADNSDEEGMSAIMLASRHGLKEAVSVLISQADINKKTKAGMTALMEAAKNNRLEVVQALEQSGADINSSTIEGMTALMFASVHGHSEIVRFVLSQAIHINACNHTGETALMMAIPHEKFEIMQLLLEKGAAVNTQNVQGLSPLMLATKINFLEGVSLLLKFNPANQLEIREVNGETALIMAAKHGHQELVCMLLQNGADIWARTFQGFTAKFVANCCGHLAIEDVLYAWERKTPQKLELKFESMDMNLSIEQYLEKINLTHRAGFFVENVMMETIGEFKNLSQRRRGVIEDHLSISEIDTINTSLEALGIFTQKFVSSSAPGQEGSHSAKSTENRASVKDAPA